MKNTVNGELLARLRQFIENDVTGIEKCSKNGNGGATKMVTTVQQNR